MKNNAVPAFTPYQRLVVFLLAITQFTVILDFMVMSPLGDIFIKSLDLSPTQFGLAVSAYAFSAGISGLLAAGFADKFDRKKLLMFFYVGFIVGTLFCGIANSFATLLAARIIAGLFGGVIGSISMAIVTDLFSLQQRGRVMGYVQMGLGVSQVMGIPISLYIANHWGWQMPFIAIAVFSVLIALIIVFRLKPVTEHLSLQHDKNAFVHLWYTIAKREYRIGFTAMALMSIGGFMMMPFGSAFAVNNLHVSHEQLPLLFLIAGIGTLIIMPSVGKLSDKMDKFRLFTFASVWMMTIVVIYTNLLPVPFWQIVSLNIMMTMGIMGRFIPAGALTTEIPEMRDRGAYMSVSASLQQMAGGIAAAFAGLVVVQKDSHSPLEHYNTLGYVVCAITAVCIFMVYRVDAMVKRKSLLNGQPAQHQPAEVPIAESVNE
jgi:predicted MFS family arabinose efflux permease